MFIEISELVLSKAQGLFQFKQVGELRVKLEEALREQKETDLQIILQEMKAHIAQGLRGISAVEQHKSKLLTSLNEQVTKVEGLRTIYNAILQR